MHDAKQIHQPNRFVFFRSKIDPEAAHVVFRDGIKSFLQSGSVGLAAPSRTAPDGFGKSPRGNVAFHPFVARRRTSTKFHTHTFDSANTQARYARDMLLPDVRDQ